MKISNFQLKETQIKKQFRHALKIQSRQFKVYQAQLLQGTPKEEQKEMNLRLKEEQNRKIASLGIQYDNNIKKMISDQTVSFSIPI